MPRGGRAHIPCMFGPTTSSAWLARMAEGRTSLEASRSPNTVMPSTIVMPAAAILVGWVCVTCCASVTGLPGAYEAGGLWFSPCCVVVSALTSSKENVHLIKKR